MTSVFKMDHKGSKLTMKRLARAFRALYFGTIPCHHAVARYQNFCWPSLAGKERPERIGWRLIALHPLTMSDCEATKVWELRAEVAEVVVPARTILRFGQDGRPAATSSRVGIGKAGITIGISAPYEFNVRYDRTVLQ